MLAKEGAWLLIASLFCCSGASEWLIMFYCLDNGQKILEGQEHFPLMQQQLMQSAIVGTSCELWCCSSLWMMTTLSPLGSRLIGSLFFSNSSRQAALIFLPPELSYLCTLGQKPNVYPEIPLILIFHKGEFCEKWDFRNVNFVKIEILEMWILSKLWFQKGEFCENCDFRKVNLVKNVISEWWILWKLRS